jgi:hypothetical protein
MATYSYQIFTIRRLSDMISANNLDLNPDWQRGSVWTRDQKPKLIDSLDEGYPIPHITLWTRPRSKYVMVDGKQRTEAMIGFINDEFAASDNDWFSGRDEEMQEAFLDKEIHALVFHSSVDEDFIVEYFERINSESKQLSNGELINALCGKPIVSNVHAMFFESSALRTAWTRVFTEPCSDTKRMKYYEDTVPYLTSSMFGVTHLTKSYPVLATNLKTTELTDVQQHLHLFNERMTHFLGVCASILEQNPHLRPGWSKHGLPPLRQMSAIWLTILEPQHVADPVSFWTTFYRMMSDDANIKNEWNLRMRKNGKPAQFYEEIQFAINVVTNV